MRTYQNSNFKLFIMVALIASLFAFKMRDENFEFENWKKRDGVVRNAFPYWSPDGSRIIFISNRDGNPEIYLTDKAGIHLHNLTNDSSLDLGAVWSNDGRKILFVSTRSGKKQRS